MEFGVTVRADAEKFSDAAPYLSGNKAHQSAEAEKVSIAMANEVVVTIQASQMNFLL